MFDMERDARARAAMEKRQGEALRLTRGMILTQLMHMEVRLVNLMTLIALIAGTYFLLQLGYREGAYGGMLIGAAYLIFVERGLHKRHAGLNRILEREADYDED